MNREIIFRAKCSGVWRYGSYVHFDKKPIHDCYNDKYRDFIVTNGVYGEHYYPITELSSLGQYTGLKDKKGTKIFEGDIISYYATENYCINPDCDLAVQGYGSKLIKKECEVKYIDDETDYSLSISYCGIGCEDFNELKECVENDSYFDTNGYELDNSIVGVEVIGNVTDNPELIK